MSRSFSCPSETSEVGHVRRGWARRRAGEDPEDVPMGATGPFASTPQWRRSLLRAVGVGRMRSGFGNPETFGLYESGKKK